MRFLAVEQQYLHGWKAGDVKILLTWVTMLNQAESVCFKSVI